MSTPCLTNTEQRTQNKEHNYYKPKFQWIEILQESLSYYG